MASFIQTVMIVGSGVMPGLYLKLRNMKERLSYYLFRLLNPNIRKDTSLAVKYSHKIMSSNKRGIPFTLTYYEYCYFLKREYCFYTGIKLTEKTLSLERIDNDLGYTFNNVVACIESINMCKNRLSTENIIDITRGLMKKGVIKKPYIKILGIKFNVRLQLQCA